MSSRAGLEHLYGDALDEFRQLAKQMDPEGKFCNENLALSIDTNIERMCQQKGLERKFKKFKKWFRDLVKFPGGCSRLLATTHGNAQHLRSEVVVSPFRER